MASFKELRAQIRKQDPGASFQRWAEFNNGTGLQAVYHHWNNRLGKMLIFIVFEDTGEFTCFESLDVLSTFGDII